jgi:uroporphyrinogen III methyltransferase/synthase
MGVKTLPAIAAALIEGGMPPEIPAAAIQWGTVSRQRTVVATLATLADEAEKQGISAPVISVIGWPVVLRDEIQWFESRPLFGRQIVVTRAAQTSTALSDKLAELGADVIEMPATKIARLDLSPLREEMKNLDEYGWLIFTSRNAVTIFWEQLLGGGRDARALAGLKIAAVGPATAGALLERGIAVDVIPQRFVAEGLLEKLTERDDVSGARVLYVTAEGAREVLPDGLAALGADVNVIEAYRSIQDGASANSLKRALESGSVSAVTFTSASSVKSYVEIVGDELSLKSPGASIGPQTTEAITAAGIELLSEAEESTIDGLVAAVVGSFS